MGAMIYFVFLLMGACIGLIFLCVFLLDELKRERERNDVVSRDDRGRSTCRHGNTDPMTCRECR